MDNQQTEKEQLIKLRGRLSKAKQCSGFHIFRDEELKLLLIARPMTLKALSEIKGFPPEGSRVTKWGQSIVDVFTKRNIKDFEVTIGSDGEASVRTSFEDMSVFGTR